ncbi:hypothetical protein BI227_003486 [Salmonella enterica subsp. enterica serovar Orion]|nr:hypothetical protein [Salmonella enterica subsp. enterica serovar Orion]
MGSNIIELVKSGHEQAAELKASCGAVDVRSVAQLISDLASQLDVQLARSNALAAENELARKAVQAFCDVVGDNIEVISEEVGRDGVLVILEAMKATGNMPATDAFLAEVRAQGVEMFSEKFGGGTQLSDMVKEVAADFSAKLRKGVAQ